MLSSPIQDTQSTQKIVQFYESVIMKMSQEMERMLVTQGIYYIFILYS